MTKRMPAIVVMAIAGVLLSGCAANKQKYSWAGYDQALYDYYKHPGDVADYMKVLRIAIDEASRTHKRVAPGIYAEYGYMLMQQKQYEEAARYFEQEKEAWPESASFMDGMIKMTRVSGGKNEGGDNS